MYFQLTLQLIYIIFIYLLFLFQVFAADGELPGENKNALWSLYFSSRNQKGYYQNDKILYGDKIYLYHTTGNYLRVNDNVKSPTTGHAEGIFKFCL